VIFGQLRLFLTKLLPAHRANDKGAMRAAKGCVLCMICAAIAAREATGNPSHDLLLTKSAVERAAILGKAAGVAA
jgi:hypothetical protein